MHGADVAPLLPICAEAFAYDLRNPARGVLPWLLDEVARKARTPLPRPPIVLHEATATRSVYTLGNASTRRVTAGSWELCRDERFSR